MQCLFVVYICVAACVAMAIARPQQYTTKYDNINVDQILRNDRLLRSYVNCLLDKGKCSPEGTELKRNISDALKTSCAKCSERQRVGSRKMIRYLIDNRRSWWNELEAKYDKDGIYRKKYEAESANQGIRL